MQHHDCPCNCSRQAHRQSRRAGTPLHICKIVELLLASRWQVLEPGARAFAGAVTHLHGDLEAEIWRILVALNCAPFMQQYRQVCSSPRSKSVHNFSTSGICLREVMFARSIDVPRFGQGWLIRWLQYMCRMHWRSLRQARVSC